MASKISVIRDGFIEPLTATALFREYVPSNDKQAFVWKKFPSLMIAKVAEMLALRRAFPHELSGLYSQEEMEQSQKNTRMAAVTTTAVNMRDAIIDEIVAIMRKLTSNFTDKNKLEWLQEAYCIPCSKDLVNAEEWKKKNILERLREELEEEPLSESF
ncbi:MAG: recombinase RecT [Oligoflexia bacterium]|nr:recombinase RecT [Oligoflexia bacterium]